MHEDMNDKNKSMWCGYGDGHWGGRKLIKLAILLLIIFAVFKMFNGGWKDKNAQQDTIVVSGKGELIVKPDIATVSFSVMEENIDVSKASDAVNTKISKIVDTLKADGIDEKDIKTTDYSVYPRYDYRNSSQTYPGGTQVLAGYDVTQSIEVKIRDLSKTGKVITDLGNLKVTNMSGLNFTNDKYDDLVRQARDAAIADARDQAYLLRKSRKHDGRRNVCS
jgi:hypothetical protein